MKILLAPICGLGILVGGLMAASGAFAVLGSESAGTPLNGMYWGLVFGLGVIIAELGAIGLGLLELIEQAERRSVPPQKIVPPPQRERTRLPPRKPGLRDDDPIV